MQCDVHRNPDNRSGTTLYLLDIQANLLSDLRTRVVVPLIKLSAFGRRANRLHPVFSVENEDVVMATHLLAAIHQKDMGPRVISLREERATILAAIDVLWSGV